MRFQLALNVRDLDEAVAWYTRFLGVGPAKRKPGYANFACDDPPLKLVLFEAPGAAERLNHVGFETDDETEVERIIARLEPAGLADVVDRDETCCYARKSTVWSRDPQDLRWEFYRKREDLDEPAAPPSTPTPEPTPATGCCGAGT